MAPRSSEPLDEKEAQYDLFDNVDSNEILNFYSENEGLGSVPHGSSSSPPLRPTAEMEVQPAQVSRFRYPSENRNRTIIYGAGKTYASVRVNNYEGPVKIEISCVSQDAPYSPHPHELVGENCNNGFMTIFGNITAENRVVLLMNFGIQCTRYADVEKSLTLRKKKRIDPFKTGFEESVYTALSHHHVRLGVKVFVADAAGRCRVPLAAVASDVVTDQPLAVRIVYVSHDSGSARGGTKLVLLTDKLPSGDLKVVFEEKSTGWRAEARPQFVHKRFAVVVCTPPYRDPDTKTPVSVLISVSHANDNVNAMQGSPFEYEPDLPCTSLAGTPPKRRFTGKGPHPTLLTDRRPPSQNPHPSTSARACPSRCDTKSFDESFQTGQLLPNYQPSYETGQTSHTRLPLPMNSHQMGQPTLTGPPLAMNSHQLGEYTSTGQPLAMNSHQMGQSTWIGPPLAMNSHQMGQSTSTGQPLAMNSHQMGQSTSTGQPLAMNSHQMGQSTSTGQPLAMNSHQMGQSTSTGQPLAMNSHQMGQSTWIGPPLAINSHQMGQSTSTGQPLAMNSHQMGQSTSTGPPLAMNSHQMEQDTSTGQPLAMNSHQMGQSTSTGQPLAMNSYQMGQSTSTGQPLAMNSHQMGQSTSTGQPLAMNSHQMGQSTSTGQPLAMNSHQMGQSTWIGTPLAINSHQMGQSTSTGQPLAMNSHQMEQDTSTGQPLAMNSHQMGQFTSTGQPLAMNFHQMEQYISTGQPLAMISHQIGQSTLTRPPLAMNSHQMGQSTSTGQPLAMNSHQLKQTFLDERSSDKGQSFLKIQSHTEQITSMQTNFNAQISKQPFSIRSSYPKDNPSVIKQPSEESLLDLHSVEGQFSPIEHVSVTHTETHDSVDRRADMLEVEEIATFLSSPAPMSNRDPTKQTQYQNDQQMTQGLDEDAKNLLDELFDPDLEFDKEMVELSDSLDKTLKIALNVLGYE